MTLLRCVLYYARCNNAVLPGGISSIMYISICITKLYVIIHYNKMPGHGYIDFMIGRLLLTTKWSLKIPTMVTTKRDPFYSCVVEGILPMYVPARKTYSEYFFLGRVVFPLFIIPAIRSL